MAQILPSRPGIGERFATGIGTGLKALTEQKIKDFQRQGEVKRSILGLEAAGIPSEQAKAIAEDRSPLGQVAVREVLRRQEAKPFSKETLEKSFEPEVAAYISSLPSKELQTHAIKGLGNKGSQEKLHNNLTKRIDKASSEIFPDAKGRFANMAHTLYEELGKRGTPNSKSINYIMNLMDKIKPLIEKNKSKNVTSKLIDKLGTELGDEDLIRAVLSAGGYELS